MSTRVTVALALRVGCHCSSNASVEGGLVRHRFFTSLTDRITSSEGQPFRGRRISAGNQCQVSELAAC
jgi:hypothetical protein